MKKERLPDLIAEIIDEIDMLEKLVFEIRQTFRDMPKSKKKRAIYNESLALKLHNFYTGCERVFQRIASDINGGLPTSQDWHRRLLKMMSLDVRNVRPAVISRGTANALEEYLAFRHVVRNIYGFEIDDKRLDGLIQRVDEVWEKFSRDIRSFVDLLRSMIG